MVEALDETRTGSATAGSTASTTAGVSELLDVLRGGTGPASGRSPYSTMMSPGQTSAPSSSRLQPQVYQMSTPKSTPRPEASPRDAGNIRYRGISPRDGSSRSPSPIPGATPE